MIREEISIRRDSSENEFVFTDADFSFIRDIIFKKTGIVFRQEKKTLVYGRLTKRIRQLSFTTFKEYCDLITSEKGKEEIPTFINAMTTNLTRFFREEYHFDHVRTELIPQLLEKIKSQKMKPRLRFWSAGCSSGEEPYSLAMTLASQLPAGIDCKILATDIDTNMINHGKRGLYQNIKGISPEYVKLYIKETEHGYEMKPELRSMVTFNPLNLMESWPMKGPFQAVFCRNVVIYFDKPTQAQLFERISTLLEAHNYLYIGHSESLFRITDKFDLIGQTIYERSDT